MGITWDSFENARALDKSEITLLEPIIRRLIPKSITAPYATRQEFIGIAEQEIVNFLSAQGLSLKSLIETNPEAANKLVVEACKLLKVDERFKEFVNIKPGESNKKLDVFRNQLYGSLRNSRDEYPIINAGKFTEAMAVFNKSLSKQKEEELEDIRENIQELRDEIGEIQQKLNQTVEQMEGKFNPLVFSKLKKLEEEKAILEKKIRFLRANEQEVQQQSSHLPKAMTTAVLQDAYMQFLINIEIEKFKVKIIKSTEFKNSTQKKEFITFIDSLVGEEIKTYKKQLKELEAEYAKISYSGVDEGDLKPRIDEINRKLYQLPEKLQSNLDELAKRFSTLDSKSKGIISIFNKPGGKEYIRNYLVEPRISDHINKMMQFQFNLNYLYGGLENPTFIEVSNQIFRLFDKGTVQNIKDDYQLELTLRYLADNFIDKKGNKLSISKESLKLLESPAGKKFINSYVTQDKEYNKAITEKLKKFNLSKSDFVRLHNAISDAVEKEHPKSKEDFNIALDTIMNRVFLLDATSLGGSYVENKNLVKTKEGVQFVLNHLDDLKMCSKLNTMFSKHFSVNELTGATRNKNFVAIFNKIYELAAKPVLAELASSPIPQGYKQDEYLDLVYSRATKCLVTFIGGKAGNMHISKESERILRSEEGKNFIKNAGLMTEPVFNAISNELGKYDLSREELVKMHNMLAKKINEALAKNPDYDYKKEMSDILIGSKRDKLFGWGKPKLETTFIESSIEFRFKTEAPKIVKPKVEQSELTPPPSLLTPPPFLSSIAALNSTTSMHTVDKTPPQKAVVRNEITPTAKLEQSEQREQSHREKVGKSKERTSTEIIK